MATVENQNPQEFSSFQENVDYLTGAGPAPASSAPNTQASAPSAPSQPSSSTPAQSAPMTSPSAGGQSYQPIDSSMDILDKTSQGVGDVIQQFNEGVGQDRTFADTGGVDAVRQNVLSGNTDPVEQNLGAQYSGPTNIDLSGLQGDFDALETQKQAMNYGLQNYLRDQTPGLTGGEARYDAGRMKQDPEFLRQRGEYEQGVDDLYANLATREKEAAERVAQRQAQEADIAAQTEAAVRAMQQEYYGDIDQSVERAAGDDAYKQKIYDLLKQMEPEDVNAAITGGALPPDLLGFDPAALNTPGQQQVAEAESWQREVMQRPAYASIADLPVGSIRINEHGQERFTLHPDGKRTRPKGVSKAEYNLAKQRYEELESKLGYNTLSKRSKNAIGSPFLESVVGGTGLIPDFEPRSRKDPGALANVDPLYFGGDIGKYEAPSIQPYMNYQEGVSPTRENMATEDQREVVNRLHGLLGEVTRLQEAGLPWEADQILANTEKFIADEERELESRGNKLTANQKSWRSTVKKARRDHKKLENMQRIAIGTAVAGGALGFGGIPLAPLNMLPLNPSSMAQNQAFKKDAGTRLLKTSATGLYSPKPEERTL